MLLTRNQLQYSDLQTFSDGINITIFLKKNQYRNENMWNKVFNKIL